MKQLLVVDKFCFRQFEANSGKLQILYNMKDFEMKVNEALMKAGGEAALKPGYAPFCKHFFVENFTDTKSNVLKITPNNRHLLYSSYEARTEKELPVLCRWFRKEDLGQELRKAKFLDCILYSREQIRLENKATGDQQQLSEVPWGIVSVKPQDVDFELPMNPITQMRNSLGKSEGGSGVPIDRASYMRSVNYWNDVATVR